MRAYTDVAATRNEIVRVDDRVRGLCEEVITSIVCDNPAELDALHDFLVKHTNIADLRTEKGSIIDDVKEPAPTASHLLWGMMEDERANDLKNCRDARARLAFLYNVYTALDEINKILREDADELDQFPIAANKIKIQAPSDRIRELEAVIETNNTTIHELTQDRNAMGRIIKEFKAIEQKETDRLHKHVDELKAKHADELHELYDLDRKEIDGLKSELSIRTHANSALAERDITGTDANRTACYL